MTRGTFLPAPYLDEYGEADKVIFSVTPIEFAASVFSSVSVSLSEFSSFFVFVSR